MYKTILVPLDGTERSRAVLPHVRELARRFEAKIVLVRAVTTMTEAVRETANAYAPQVGMDTAKRRVEAEGEAARRQLEATAQELRQAGLTVSVEVGEGSPAHVILDVAAAHSADLIGMATRGRGALGQLILGSVADDVVRDSELPVLLVRAP